MPYCVRADIEAVFGVENVKKWADLDNDKDTVKIAARIATAITVADSEIDDKLRQSIYTIPLEDEDAETVPQSIINISAALAGTWLYEARGVIEYNPVTGKPHNPLEYHKHKAEHTIKEILGGVRKLAAKVRNGMTTAPKAG